jgi:hypothetical protein
MTQQQRSARRRLTLAATALLCAAGPSAAQELSTATLERWLSGYEQAWETRDAARAAELFTTDARYQEMPFDTPKIGRDGIRDYWATVTADQRDIDFRSAVVAVNGATGVARWSATFTAAGARVELDGVFILTFDATGHCTELREWWHVKGP